MTLLLLRAARTRTPHRLVERNLRAARHSWTALASGLLEPVFYLFSIRVGIGRLVGDLEAADGTSLDYAAFVAPALLAAAAMNAAVYEATMNVFSKLRYQKVYDAALATPLEPEDVAVGEVAWSVARGLVYSAVFLTLMTAMGLATSWWTLAVLPAVLLMSVAFSAVAIAAVTFMRTWQDFDLIVLVTLPLFLFSATFYPLDVYPSWLQVVARISPLYHGTELVRALTSGRLDASIVAHVAVLVALGVVGMAVGARRLRATLRP